MTKLLGPLLSIAASGRLVNLLFRTANGATHLILKNTPSQPNTRIQVARRQLLAALAQAWINTSDADRASWNSYPRHAKMSAYHAFVRENFARHDHGLYPTTHWPAPAHATTHVHDATGPTGRNRCFSFWLSNPSGTVPVWLMARLRTGPPTAFPPSAAMYWSCISPPLPHRMDVFQATPGTWTIDTLTVDRDGGTSNIHFLPNITILD